jgi:hypothetical protein
MGATTKLLLEVRKRVFSRGAPYDECPACVDGRAHTDDEWQNHPGEGREGVSRENGTPPPADPEHAPAPRES